MDTSENEIELIDLLNVIWKRKWLIIIPAFFLAVAAGIVSFLIPPKWEVDAILQPSKFFVQTEQGQFEEVFVADPRQIAGQINQKSYDSLIASELNIDERKFPKLSAENLRDTKLVRVVIRDTDVARAKSVLHKLFDYLKIQLDKKIEVEAKAINSKITTYERNIKEKELDIQSKEIEKSRTKQQISSAENKLKISEQRAINIAEEMKSVKKRTEEIEKQQRESLEGKKEGMEAISLLLYSNEVQQNLRYYNTLEENLSGEKITQENLGLTIKEGQEEIKQLNTDIEKLKNVMEEDKNQINLLNDKKARIDYA
ncbi:MAG: Wzz/FepE/Etk N-terminal domain-containing protein, partial [Candidatus Aminicenantales bacterium]